MFKMSEIFLNPAKWKIRSVIRFLNAKKVHPVEIHREIQEVYGNNVMDEARVRKWCLMFNEGTSNVHGKDRSGRSFLVTDELKQQSTTKFVRADA